MLMHDVPKPMDIAAYLDRINYRGPLECDAETLRQLQLAHLRSVPFENLSIHAGEPIVLNDDALFEKIVKRKRGGFCYELNGLFSALLRTLGFKVERLSAQVANAAGEFSCDFDHMTLMVTLAEPWLVDVGFGESFVEPLRVGERGPQLQAGRAYRIEAADHYLVGLQFDDQENAWKPFYRFTLTPYDYPDFEELCRFHQTSPESHFTQNRICSMLTPSGRISLTGAQLIVTAGGERSEQPISTPEQYERLLRENFGIAM
jgi:N-hydroxyarylamine O-acetyltransferase